MLYWDPKSEFAEWFDRVTESEEMQQKYPLFINHLKTFKYVTLNYEDSTNYGCLDPIVFLDGIEANEMLKSVFDEIKSLKIIIILKRQFIKLFLIRLKNAKMAKSWFIKCN